MKRFFFTSIFICLYVLAFNQEINLTFTANYHSEYTSLDSVLIENSSQSGDTTLYWPDTVLNLDLSSIPEMVANPNQISLSQNYPNPFNGSSETTLFLPSSEKVYITLYDLHTRKLAEYQEELSRGYHNFCIYPGKFGTCILTVRVGNITKQLKMINTEKNSSNIASIMYHGNPSIYNTEISHLKQTREDRSNFIYSSGDALRYTGYINGASAHVNDVPDQDSTYLINIHPTFDFVIETTEEQTSYSFTIGGSANLEVIWEAGQTEMYNSGGVKTHDFGEAGMWHIKMRGTTNYIMFDENPEMFRDILTPVEPAVTGIMLSANMFRGITVSSFTCENWFDQAAQGISDMSHMFNGSAYNQDISNWNMSSATNLSGMFAGSDFNQPLNDWDVRNVETFAMMFSGSAYNQDLSNWNVSGATDMSDMFSYSEFNQPIGNWDVSNVTNMACMFSYSIFNQDISNWDVSNVTNMGYMPYSTNGMFQNSAFDQDISSWDVSNVTNFTNFLKNSALSTEHYNNLLIQWSELNLQSGVTFDGGNSMYDLGLPAEQRQYIIDEFDWIFNDGGDSGVEY
jgi:surface protein